MSQPTDSGKAGSKSRSLGSIEADHIQRKLAQAIRSKQAPSPEGAPRRQAVLPTVKAPSLDNLLVSVPAPAALTEQDVLERLHELALEHAGKRERAPGEPVRLGDLVLLDTLGYAEGRLIPFSARGEVELELAEQALLPGFCEALVGTPVGEGREVEVTLPGDYPVEELRGVKATFLVDVLAAQEVALPDSESEAFLQVLERGRTLDEVLASIADELEDELAEESWLEAQERVLDELVLRTGDVALTPELVDEEIRQRWEEGELPLLRAKDFDEDEQREALEGWLNDENTRLEAERSLRVGLALRAIVERDQLRLTPEKLEELLVDAVVPLGLSEEEARQALADPQAAGPIRDSALHLLAVDHVMERARIQFEGLKEVLPGRPPRA